MEAEAHKIKAIGGTIDFPELTTAATNLENSTKTKDSTQISLRLVQLTTLCMHAMLSTIKSKTP